MHTSNHYETWSRPKLAQLLRAFKLDQHFVRAAGSTVYDADGRAVLDLVSGFGACLLGHNPPALKKRLIEQLQSDLPSFMMGSIAADTARLGERLNAELAVELGREPNPGYYLQLSNGGAEAAEAAIKHAYKVMVDRLSGRQQHLTQLSHEFARQCAGMEIALPPGHQSVKSLCSAIERHNKAMLEQARGAPCIVALKGSYHGRTGSTLKVTSNPTYRVDFAGLSALRPIFIPLDAPEYLAEVVRAQLIELRYPHWVNGQVEVGSVLVPQVIAFVMEPILGEGGVRVVPEATLQRLADLHGELDVPFIIDEVQTGYGRSGRVFDFSQTPLAAIDPEYLLLGKALGGGVSKLGATLIRRDVYDPDFGLMHSSTFAEDPPSAQMALATLDLLTADNRALLDHIRQVGASLQGRLQALHSHFPEVVREVRGRGLMLGMELRAPVGSGPRLQAAHRRGALALLIASYLMHHHAIRLIAPLHTMLGDRCDSVRPSVLRIQAAATLSGAEIEHFVSALAEVLVVIQRNDEQRLFDHLDDLALAAFDNDLGAAPVVAADPPGPLVAATRRATVSTLSAVG